MSRKSRRDILKVGGVTAIAALAGCTSGGDDGDGSDGGDGGDGTTSADGGSGDGDAIVVGALEPLSGPFSPWGGPHLEGMEFAIQEKNAEDGVLGRDLRVAAVDSEGQPSTADTGFRRLVEQEGAVAVAGPVSSDVGIRTSGTAGDLEVPLYLNQSGSEAVIDGETRYTFRGGLLPAAKTMEAQSGLAADAGYTEIGAIVADYAWGHSSREAINEEFDVDVNVQVAPVDASDFKPYIRRLSRDVEMVIAQGHPPGALSIANQLYQLNYSPEVITGSGTPPGLVLNALGDNVGRGYTDHHLADFRSEAFLDVATRFAEQYEKPMGPHATYGYVTGTLIAECIENGGEADPTAVAEETRNIELDTVYAEPLQYTDYGELQDPVQLYSQVAPGGPEYYPDGDYHYEEVYRTEPLSPLEPES